MAFFHSDGSCSWIAWIYCRRRYKNVFICCKCRIKNVIERDFSSFPTTEWNFISYGSYGGYSEQAETIYMAYNKLIMSVFHNPQWVLIITAAITCYFMMRFIRNNVEQYSDLYLATYVYMCDSIYMSSFNIMRQGLALSIAAQAIEEVKYEKYKKAIVWVAIAMCFHLSALLFVAVLLIYKLKEKEGITNG